MIAIISLWLVLCAGARADDFFFYLEHNSGSQYIDGNVIYGGSATNFLSYPCTSSIVFNGIGAQWVAYVDTSASVGVYNTGMIPGSGESVWIEIY